MTNESLRQQMGAKGELTAVEYDWKRVSQSVLNYYLKVLGSGTPPKEKLQETKAIPL